MPISPDTYIQALNATGCFHAGPYYTHVLLAELGVSEAPGGFTSDARRLVLARRAGKTSEPSLGDWSADFATGEPVSGIICFLDFSLDVAGNHLTGRQLFVSEARPGSYSLEDATRSPNTTPISAKVQLGNLLVAAPLAHDRSGHAEFLALGRVLSSGSAAGMDAFSVASRQSVTGTVHLYVTHHPCLSCVGAISQFNALLPNVSLRVSYDWHPVVPRGG